MGTFVKNNVEAQEFIRNVTLLAFLPAEDIPKEHAQLLINLSPQVKSRLRPFTRYFLNFWMRVVRPEGFSVFGLLIRTNNVQEAYHARLVEKFGVHPSAWDFLSKYFLIAVLIYYIEFQKTYFVFLLC